MPERRPLCPAERMVDVFDRASTLSFTVVATLRGPLSEAGLEAALRAVEARHPLLRASIERAGSETLLRPGGAAAIPLHVTDAPEQGWQTIAEASLAHRVWDDAGPRAELHLVRHGAERSTLLLCMHHVISDATSGIIVLRDLVQHVNREPFASAVVPSPGQTHLYPTGHASVGWQLRAAWGVAKSMLGKRPFRYRPDPASARRVGLVRLVWDPDQAQALARRAKQDGATVHGLLCAAVALAVAKQAKKPLVRQRLVHPVDLRRGAAQAQSLGDAVGYYVSSVTTEHALAQDQALGPLAGQITHAVHTAKARAEQLLSAPIQGPWITQRVRGAGELRAFRDGAEQKLMANTFSITNLGVLERLGVHASRGATQIEDLFYVAAGSVLSSLGGSASMFGGKLSLTLGWVEPTVPRTTAEALASDVREALAHYAGLPAPLADVAQ